MSSTEDLPDYTAHPPPSWFDDDRLETPITLQTTVVRAMVFHGAMVLACKHPEIQKQKQAYQVLQDMLDHLEAMFQDLGLERPLTGWRGKV